MSRSHFLNLPFIAPSQAQKHVTHNEAILGLDNITQLSVECQCELLPPAPEMGTRIIVTTGDQANDIAIYLDTQWHFITPRPGWLCWDSEIEQLLVYGSNSWVGAGPIAADIPDLDNLTVLGVNADADASNRFSLSSHASLFNHDGSDHRLAINKSAQGDIASVLWQNGFVSKAEFGLTGDDDLHLKVSPNGTNWIEALQVETQTGMSIVRGLRSGTVAILDNASADIPTPSGGGIILLVITDPIYSRVTHSGILAYDSGNSPQLVSMILSPHMTNQGTSSLSGMTGPGYRSNIAVKSGYITIENRSTADHTYSYTFLC